MLENKIYQHLSTSATVVNQVGTRIYPLVASQNPTTPYCTYQRISGSGEYHTQGYATLERVRIQIDSYSTGYTAAKTIAAGIKTAMESATGYSVVEYTDMDLFESDVTLFRVMQDFVVYNRE
jgi:hypothetical protein